MHRLALSVTAVALVLAAAGAASPATQRRQVSVDPARHSACKPTWRTVPSPKVVNGTLQAVAVRSAVDAWAVGGVVRGSFSSQVALAPPLIMRWNGEGWSLLATPPGKAVLTDVTVVSRHDAWAVGGPRSDDRWSDGADRLMLRWNGSRWSKVPLPAKVRDVNAISASASDDVWGVGTFQSGDRYIAEISHWDGRQWSRVLARSGAMLNDVVAISPSDVWAVGQERYRPLVMHWDGRRWRASVLERAPGADEAWLSVVAGLAGDDVWAGGGSHTSELSGGIIHPLELFHWDGVRWTAVRHPIPGLSWFVGLAPVSKRELWAVSTNIYEYVGDSGEGTYQWHLANGSWRIEQLTGGRLLTDIAAVAASTGDPVVWAVGQTGGGDFFPASRPLIRRYGC